MLDLSRHDIEDIILGMAEIVQENRDLRYEINRLNNIVNRQNNYINESVRESDKANKEFLKMILENTLMGSNEM